MARDLSFFSEPLAAEGEPGLSAIDTRLNAITDLAEQRKFIEAADLAEQLYAESIYDVRPISVYMLGALLEGGFLAAGDVFVALSALLGPNLAAVGPVKRREDHFNRRMVWLFDTATDLFKYHQTRRTDEWQSWTRGASGEAMHEVIQKAIALQGLLASDVYKGATLSLVRLRDWMRELMAQQKAQEPPPASVAPPASIKAGARPEPVVMVEAATDPMAPVRRRVELEVSHRFIELWTKLRAFEALIEKKQFDRAALVAEDLNALIEHFDPRDYFPELFSRFSALTSKNIDTLAHQAGEQPPERWKAMVQFYRVDLKGFVDG